MQPSPGAVSNPFHPRPRIARSTLPPGAGAAHPRHARPTPAVMEAARRVVPQAAGVGSASLRMTAAARSRRARLPPRPCCRTPSPAHCQPPGHCAGHRCQILPDHSQFDRGRQPRRCCLLPTVPPCCLPGCRCPAHPDMSRQKGAQPNLPCWAQREEGLFARQPASPELEEAAHWRALAAPPPDKPGWPPEPRPAPAAAN